MIATFTISDLFWLVSGILITYVTMKGIEQEKDEKRIQTKKSNSQRVHQ